MEEKDGTNEKGIVPLALMRIRDVFILFEIGMREVKSINHHIFTTFNFLKRSCLHNCSNLLT